MGWWKTAKPGDKVVCVNDRAFGIASEGRRLKQGEVYTVSGCIMSEGSGPLGIGCGPALVICECPNIGAFSGVEKGWCVSRFRPVQTKSTDTGMAILKRILERPEQRIEEDA